MLFHYGARRDFFRASTIAPLFLGRLLDVLVLALLLFADASQVFFLWHDSPPCIAGCQPANELIASSDKLAACRTSVAFAYTYVYRAFGLHLTHADFSE